MQNLLALPAGTELVEDYRILRVLGAGGFGLTYLAREETLDRSVTIKEYFPSDFAAREATLSVRPRSGESEEDYGWGLERFIEEAQTLARFDHPNINRVYRYFRANNTAYIVLQFEEGQSFKSWLAGLGRAPRQAELDTIVTPLLDALEIIHAGNYLHRDIAPDNIIIRKGGAPVLIDFGSARGEMVQLSKTVSALVKPGYSPYEQYGISGRQQGPWTDIYSLGATLYQAISGKRPTDAPTRMVSDDYRPAAEVALSSYRPQFLAAIDHALKLRVGQRPQSIAAWRKALGPPGLANADGPYGVRPKRKLDVAPVPKEAFAPDVQAAAKADLAPVEAQSAQAARTGLKQRLVRLLEGVAAAKNQPAAADAQAGPVLLPLQPRVQPAALAPALTAATPRADVVAVPARNGGTAVDKHRRGALGWRLFRRADAKVFKAALPAPHDRAKIPPARQTSPPARRGGSRTVALKLLAGAVLSAVLLSYQDHIRAAWSVYGWSGATDTPALSHSTTSRTAVAKKPEVRPAVATITTASTGPAAEAPPRRVAEEIVLKGHRGAVQAVSFTGDGQALVSTGQDGTLRLWDIARRELVRTVEVSEQATGALAVQERSAVVGLQDGRVALWDLDRGTVLRTFKRNDAAIWAVAFAGDAQWVVAAGHDWTMALWDLRREGVGPLHVFEGHENAVQAVAYTARTVTSSSNTGFVATGGADRLVKLWNAGDFSLVRTYRGHRDFVGALAFSPDGGLLASGGADKVVRLWPTSESSGARRLRGHKGRITAVAFSGEGQILASGSEDGTVRLWDWKRSRVVRTLAGHAGPVRALAFAPDGKSIVTAGDDGTLRVWDAAIAVRAAASRT